MANSFFSITGNIRSTVRTSQIADAVLGYKQGSLQEAERAGRKVLEEETPGQEGRTTFRLHSSIESGENQSAVWFRVAGIIDGKPYGYAQEFGWHDRAGGYHDGHHMVQLAGEAAARTFAEFMGGLAEATSSGSQRYIDAKIGEVGGYQPRGFSGTMDE